MSHDGSWRASCRTTIHLRWFHFEAHSVARGVTDPSVGSGALFGSAGTWMTGLKKNAIHAGDSGTACLERTDVGVRQQILHDSRYDMLPGLAATLDLKLTSRREPCSEPPF